jgi:RNA methyltransferase, TrmH family
LTTPAAAAVVHVTSRDNPLLKELRLLARDGAAYRKTQRIWIEGEHLCEAYAAKGLQPDIAVFSESNWQIAGVKYAQAAIKIVVISDAMMTEISALDSVAGMGFVCSLPAASIVNPALNTVVLDRLQDPGNVGSILRSAAAFGFRQVVALKGTVALYAPKVLRAGMGAHFALALHETARLQDLETLQGVLAVTSSHQGEYLHELLRKGTLPRQMHWALGHEGQGVCAELSAMAGLHVRIAQPGGEESLNVAAAAAICLHASASAAL